jgi:hypothetical protein
MTDGSRNDENGKRRRKLDALGNLYGAAFYVARCLLRPSFSPSTSWLVRDCVGAVDAEWAMPLERSRLWRKAMGSSPRQRTRATLLILQSNEKSKCRDAVPMKRGCLLQA